MTSQLLLTALNRAGNMLPHRARRFILDDLKVSRLVNRFAKNSFVEAVLPNGMMITFNPALHGHAIHDYEQDVLDALKVNLKPNGVFYDVGANIGVFSLLLSPAASQVLTFEPEENNTACSKRSLSDGPSNMHLLECAVGAADGTMTFDRRGGAFSGRLAMSAAFDGVTVPVRSLDSIVAEGHPPPNLIKIDVEGGEGAVLEGAASVLREHRPIVICEMHRDDPDGVARAFAALKSAGYEVTGIDGGQPDLALHVIAR